MNAGLHLILHTASGISQNPYLNRVMIRNVHGFYGRKRELARLYARIGASRPQSVSITGERRIGKSSLLWFLMQPENIVQHISDPDSVIFIFLDFQENREMKVEDFCATLLDPLSKQVPDVHPDGGYDALLGAVQHLDERGYKLVILLDEFETITQNPSFDERFYDFLRALANRYNVAYITSSRRPLQYLCHSKQIAGSPFFNIFSSMHLRGFTEAEARELITTPSREAGTPLEPYTDFLVDVGGTYPFFLQIVCSSLLEYLQVEDELDDLGREEVCENILEEVEPHFQYIWDRMEENERRVCRLVMEGEPIDRRNRGTLRNLVQQAYVSEGKGGNRMFSSLFAQWMEDAAVETTPTDDHAYELMAVQELQNAREMQMSLLPEDAPPIEGMEIAGRSIPANTVGGDFFDYLSLADGKVGIAIADVSGKGLRAAMNAVLTAGILHDAVTIEESCGSILSRLNAHLCPLMERQMFTAFSFAILDQDVIQWSNAGQPIPLIKRSNGVSEATGDGELPLGMMPNVKYPDCELGLQTGDIVIFYSDGIIEAENETEEMYGTERLMKLVAGIDSAANAEEVIEAILRDVAHFAGNAEQYDDMTIVVVRKLRV